MAANQKQVGGDHYRGSYQHWDFVDDAGLNYLEAQIARYITRHRRKNGLEDLEKAEHFLSKLREVREDVVEHTIPEYVHYNKLSDLERDVIVYVILGKLAEAQVTIAALKSVDYGEPGPGYVDQDR